MGVKPPNPTTNRTLPIIFQIHLCTIIENNIIYIQLLFSEMVSLRWCIVKKNLPQRVHGVVLARTLYLIKVYFPGTSDLKFPWATF